MKIKKKLLKIPDITQKCKIWRWLEVISWLASNFYNRVVLWWSSANDLKSFK